MNVLAVTDREVVYGCAEAFNFSRLQMFRYIAWDDSENREMIHNLRLEVEARIGRSIANVRR